MADILQPNIVLGIAAHPDDLDFGAAGTMAAFAKAGAAVHYLLLTDGSKGSEDRAMTPQRLTEIRHAEQQAATNVIGGKSVTFLDYPDGGLEITMQLKKDIVKVIRTIRPDLVVTTDPAMLYSSQRGFINHPDHRAAGQAALDAVFPLARDHMSFPELYAEGYEPHKVATVLLTNFEKNEYVIDITDTLDTKFEALAAHTSQVGNLEDIRKRFTDMSAEIGESAGYKYGESFIRIDIPG